MSVVTVQRTFLPVASTFATVRMISEALGGIVTAQDVQNAVPADFTDQFSVDTILAEFGALHDMGFGSKIGASFRYDGRN